MPYSSGGARVASVSRVAGGEGGGGLRERVVPAARAARAAREQRGEREQQDEWRTARQQQQSEEWAVAHLSDGRGGDSAGERAR